MHFIAPAPETAGFWSGTATEWLTSAGTVGATIVALFLGISAFLASKKDQKAREAQVRRDKAQVYCWAGSYVPASEKGGKAWIKNDTELPIHNMSVNIFTEKVQNRKHLNMGTSLILAPKETRTIDLDASYFDENLANPKVHIFVIFTDVDGFTWTRHPNGALTPFPYEKLQMPTPLDKGRPAPK